MSSAGPSLRRDSKGYAYAKFGGRKFNFGRYDDHRSHLEFDRFKLAWRENGCKVPEEGCEPPPLTIEGLVQLYLEHLRHRHDEAWLKNNEPRYLGALKPLREGFGRMPALGMTPERLTSVREAMVATGKLCRREVNERVQTIRRMFKWGVSVGRFDASVLYALESVEAIQIGEYGTHEGRQYRPVPEHVFRETLLHLSKPLVILPRKSGHPDRSHSTPEG